MAMKTSPNPAKNIRIFKNGDFNSSARRFVINDRYARNFDAFLNQVTTGLRPRFGAVRNLYTPDHGTKISKLEQLRSGADYVAGGTERFRASTFVRARGKLKEMGYKDITSDRGIHHEQSKIQKKPIVVVSARLHKFERTPTIIHVFRNGDELFKGVKFVLSRRDLHNWDQLMTAIGEKIQLRTGAVRKLYSLDGHCVSQVTNGSKYVAVGTDRFKKLPYSAENNLLVIGPGPTVRREAQATKKQVIVHHFSKQSTVTRLSVERKLEIMNKDTSSQKGKKSSVRGQKIEPAILTERVQLRETKKLTQQRMKASVQQRIRSPVTGPEEFTRDVPSSVSSLKSTHSHGQTPELFQVDSSESLNDNSETVLRRSSRDIEAKNSVFSATEESEQQVETVVESEDMQVEKTVDMIEAVEVDDMVIDEEKNQEITDNTASQQRPASWSGDSRKLKQARPTSKTSSEHSDDHVATNVDESSSHRDVPNAQIPETDEIPNETEVPDDKEISDATETANAGISDQAKFSENTMTEHNTEILDNTVNINNSADTHGVREEDALLDARETPVVANEVKPETIERTVSVEHANDKETNEEVETKNVQDVERGDTEAPPPND